MGGIYWFPGAANPADGLANVRGDVAPLLRISESGRFWIGSQGLLEGVFSGRKEPCVICKLRPRIARRLVPLPVYIFFLVRRYSLGLRLFFSFRSSLSRGHIESKGLGAAASAGPADFGFVQGGGYLGGLARSFGERGYELGRPAEYTSQTQLAVVGRLRGILYSALPHLNRRP